MGKVKPSVRFLAFILGFLLLSVFTCTAAWAYDACTYYYEALLDTDNNVATGSNGDQVMVEQGGETPHAIHGIDYIVRVVADVCRSSGQELGPIYVTAWDSNANAFVGSAIYPSFYALGFENSDIVTSTSPLHHADVIEFRALKSDIGNPHGRIKVIYHASYENIKSDYTGPLYDPPLSIGIPTLSQWGVIILGLFFGVLALFMLKKQKAATFRVLVVIFMVFSISGVVSANFVCPDKICLDGLTEDWNELTDVPSITDPNGDTSIGDPGEDILKGYVTSDDTQYYFRMDIAGGPPPEEE